MFGLVGVEVLEKSGVEADRYSLNLHGQQGWSTNIYVKVLSKMLFEIQKKLTYPLAAGTFESMIFLFPFGGMC